MLNCLEIIREVQPICGLETWSSRLQGMGGWGNDALVQCVVDSGAGASVGPRGLAGPNGIKESAGSKAGQTFTSASGKIMKHEGEVSLNCLTSTGTGMTAVFQIADITRPLLSVSKICENGNMISCGSNGGVSHHLESGTKTFFGRSNGIYVIDLYIPKTEVGF